MNMELTTCNGFMPLRPTVLANSIAMFLQRNFDRLTHEQLTTLINYQRKKLPCRPSNVVIGTVRPDYIGNSWKSIPYPVPKDGKLFSHQRVLIEHILSNEEYAMLCALGFNRPDEVRVMKMKSLLQTAHKTKDYSTLTLTDGCREVLVCNMDNLLYNSLDLYAEPCDKQQEQFLERFGTVINHSKTKRTTKTKVKKGDDIVFNFSKSLFVTIDFDHGILKTNQMLHMNNVYPDYLNRSREWKITSIRFRQCWINRTTLVNNGMNNENETDLTMRLNSTTATTTNSNTRKSITGSSPYCSVDFINAGCNTSKYVNDPHYMTRWRLMSCIMPRRYMYTFIKKLSGIGKRFATVSLCMLDRSRCNWVFDTEYIFEHWINLFAAFDNCQYYIVRTKTDLDVLMKKKSTRFDAYSVNVDYDIVLVNSKLSVSYSGLKPLRCFYFSPSDNYAHGVFNYIFVNNVPNSSSSFDNSTTVTICPKTIETMFDLPPIYYTFRIINTCKSVSNIIYDPNGVFSTDNNSAIETILHPEYTKLTFLRLPFSENKNKQEQPIREMKEIIKHLREKMLTSSCVICLDRCNDYFITKCCRNALCCVCFLKLEKKICPMCREEIGNNHMFPMMLKLSERTSAYNSVESMLHWRRHAITALLTICNNSCNSLPKVLFVGPDLNNFFLNEISSHYHILTAGWRFCDVKKNFCRFKESEDPAFLHISDSTESVELLQSFDLTFVTHLVFVNITSVENCRRLLERIHRYGRVQPLFVFDVRDSSASTTRLFDYWPRPFNSSSNSKIITCTPTLSFNSSNFI